MKTTELYFEYIIIGLETLIWMCLLVFSIIGIPFLDFLQYCIANIMASILLLGICYVLGLVIDRIADKIFEKQKIEIKRKYQIKAKTSLQVWKDYGSREFADFTLSRIRVLRSSIFNFLLIGIFSGYVSIVFYGNISLSIVIFLIGLALSIASYVGHKDLLTNYYKKTQALEK